MQSLVSVILGLQKYPVFPFTEYAFHFSASHFFAPLKTQPLLFRVTKGADQKARV